MGPQAYVLRITLGGINSMQLALDTDTIIIGWSKAASLLKEELDWEQFRQVLIDSYPDYKNKNNLRGAGNALPAITPTFMWLRLKEMLITFRIK